MMHISRFLELSLIISTTFLASCLGRVGTAPNTTFSISPSTHACYALDQFELCIPYPNQGYVIAAKSTLTMEELTKSVVAFTGSSSDRRAQVIGDQLYDVTALFPDFIAKRFNRLVNFSGPNCYNTALLASGGIDSDQLRYYSPEEFDHILATEYQEVPADQAKFGDILVFDAKHSREHVALYLGHDLIFHKKGVMKGYGYRITAIDKAYDFEPGEWQESPLKLLLPTDSDVIKAPRGFYRLKEVVKIAPRAEFRPLIDTIEQAVLTHAPMWRVPQEMGILSEAITLQLKKDLVAESPSAQDEDKLIKARLTSLHDQIFLSIDETLFQTPRGITRHAEIRTEFCYSEKSKFINDVVRDLAALYRPEKELSANEAQVILTSIGGYDRSSCNAPVTSIIKNQVANP